MWYRISGRNPILYYYNFKFAPLREHIEDIFEFNWGKDPDRYSVDIHYITENTRPLINSTNIQQILDGIKFGEIFPNRYKKINNVV